MSLATRCTACGTIFRVVEDQLRVSDGWVRCGRCAEVFDAREQLFDIEREAPPPWAAHAPHAAPPPVQVAPTPMQAPAPVPAQHAHEPAPPVPRPAAEPAPAMYADPESIGGDDFESEEPAFEPHAEMRAEPRYAPQAEPDPRIDDRTEPVFAEPSFEPPQPTPEPEVVVEPHLAQMAEMAAGRATDAAHAPASPAADAAAATPSFLRRAEAKARWRRPGVRAALASGCMLGVILLAAQMSLQFRDAIASLWPQTSPLLRATCNGLGCEVKAWRRIDAIAVEQSGLSQAGAGNNYKLTLTLHNKSGQNLALPWVDLSLTDANGQLVSRRMLSPAEFNLHTDTISAGAEQALAVVFSTGEQRVTGYTVEIFHP